MSQYVVLSQYNIFHKTIGSDETTLGLLISVMIVCFLNQSKAFNLICNHFEAVKILICFPICKCISNNLAYMHTSSHTHLQNSLHLIETMKLAGAFAIKRRQTWATYVPYACPYSVSITRNVQPVGEQIYHLLSCIMMFMTCCLQQCPRL